ncbi:MAG: arsenite methyltransferase [Kofleriaceae bacterium]|nr:arsenite methyltransferase [Kofleriaceae bacterium]
MTKKNCCGPSTSSTETNAADADNIRQGIRESYEKVAQASNQETSEGVPASCCGVSDDSQINSLISTRLGYSEGDLDKVPEGADMGLGCGNPRAIASLKEGEVVVDLGSGGGFDCFLAAPEVGESGKVIGIDMTPEMISKARKNASKGKYQTVEFRLGEIENMPVADNTADVIISNCVINLSPDKARVFTEAFRILKPKGRLAISDVVATAELPEEMKNDKDLLAGCMAGAIDIAALERMMKDAGFTEVKIEPKDESRDFIRDWAPGRNVQDYVVSATIEAVKP